MALTSVDFSTTFDYTVSPKLFRFEDTTDYAGQGIALTQVVGVLEITAPSGTVIYNNTNFGSPDINPDVSLENSTTIQLPLMGDGSVMQGNYSIKYTVRVAATTLDPSYDVEETKSINFNYTTPTGDLEIEANLATPLMTSTDTTNYTIIFNGSPINPSSITRDHRLYYPATVGVSPVTGTTSVISTNTIYSQSGVTLVYLSTLVSDLEYDLGGGFYVLDEVDANAQYNLAVDTTLCNLYCGIKTIYTNWQTYKGTPRGIEYLNKLQVVTSIGQLLQTAVDCGKSEDISTYASMIRNVGGFTEDCDCSNGTPVLVTGTGGSGTVVVEAGTGMAVSVATGGGVTTYTVSLSGANASKLASLYNTSVQAGTGISIASATDVNGNITYTITNSQTQPNMLSFAVTVTPSPTNLPAITTNFYYSYGTKFQSPTVENVNDGSASDWQNQNNQIKVSDFFSGASSNYTVHVDAIKYTTINGDETPDFLMYYTVKCAAVNASDFILQIFNEIGYAPTGNELDDYTQEIKFNVTIIA